MERIIEFLFFDEIRNWEAKGKPRNHIYRDVRRADTWLGEETEGKRAPEAKKRLQEVPQGWRNLRAMRFHGQGGGQNHPAYQFGRWLETSRT